MTHTSDVITHEELLWLLEEQVKEQGYRGCGRALGFTGTYIHRLANGLQPITPSVAKALGYTFEPPMYRRLK